jgi:hypothetical protein
MFLVLGSWFLVPGSWLKNYYAEERNLVLCLASPSLLSLSYALVD